MTRTVSDRISNARSIARRRMGAFRRDEDGSMIIFGLFMFVMMLAITGLAVDLMRFETTRAKLQGTMDRAVLAAADLDQTRPPIQVVQDYFAKAGMSSFLVGTPTVVQGLNFRRVTAQARGTMPMFFGGLLKTVDNNWNSTSPTTFDNQNHQGYQAVQPVLSVPANATAEEKVAKVEISLVLDISGSMKDNNRIRNLRTAATQFVTTVLDPANAGLISVSLVPYSEHVNAGPLLYNQLNVNTRHNFSHCIEFPDSQFNATALNRTMTYEQMQHFQWNWGAANNYQNTRTDTVCPRYSYEQITPWSQNRTALNNQISQLQPRAGTSIFLGMKWGVALLDPSTRPMLTTLSNSGNVDTVFRGRPVDYSDVETLKAVVLMTDGKNDRSNRIRSTYYDSTSEYAHWNSYNFWYYLNYYVNSYYHSNFYYQKYDAATGDTLLDNMCDQAKAAGIVVWTIGFEVDQHGADIMEQCASSPSHFYRVEGVNISVAFASIARQINNLKLTF